jgi:Mg-chelatase subunit ChlD
MNEEFENNSSIDTELQVRLMNLVMGEASDFERDQLQAMMEQQPELAAYYQHLEHLHGLLCEVGAGEPSLESDATDSVSEWRLPGEQREKLLAVLDGPILSPSDQIDQQKTTVELARSISTKLKSYVTRRWLSGFAVAAASLLLGFMIFPRSRFGKDQLVSERANVSFAGETTGSRYFEHPATNSKALSAEAVVLSRRSQFGLESVTAELGEARMAGQTSEAPATSLATRYYHYRKDDFASPSGPSVVAISPTSPNSTPAAPEAGFGDWSSQSLPLSSSGADRFGRGRQSAQSHDSLAANLPSSSNTQGMDGASSVGNFAGEMPGGGGMGGGGMGGGGMGGGMAGMGGMRGGVAGMLGDSVKSRGTEGSKSSAVPGNAIAGRDFAKSDPKESDNAEYNNGQMGATEGRELAERDSVNKNLLTFQSRGKGFGPPDIPLDSLMSQSVQAGQAQSLQEGELSESLALHDRPISPDQRHYFGNNSGAAMQEGGSALGWSIETPSSGWTDSKFADLGTNTSLGVPLPAYELSMVDGESAGEVAAVPVPTSESVEQLYSVTVPDGGSIALGGIQKNRSDEHINRLFANGSAGGETSDLMTDVTPRIVVQEEEEVRLGVADAERPLISLAELHASESRIKVDGDLSFPSLAAPPPIDIRRSGEGKSDLAIRGESRLDDQSNDVDSASIPTMDDVDSRGWEEFATGGKDKQAKTPSGNTNGRGLNRSSGTHEYNDSELLGEVQIEVVDSIGEIKIRGRGQDVQRSRDAIEQIEQQAQQESGIQKAKRTSDAKPNASKAQSQANAEWYKKQIEGFQATNGNGTVTNEQLAELKKSFYLPQDEPADAADFNSNFVVGDATEHFEASKDVAPEIALKQLAPFLFNKENAQPSSVESRGNLPELQPVDSSSSVADFVEADTKYAPSPEAIERHRFVRPPVTAGKPAEGKLAETDTTLEKAGESKVEAAVKSESKGVAKGAVISPKPAKPNVEELARMEATTKFMREKRPSIDEQVASKEAFSTFSLHVSDVSFKLAQAALSQGQWPEAAKIRIEEFVNALDYRDPLPSGNERVACRIEQAVHPFLIQRNMLRVSMRTAATGRSQNTPLRLTILLDNSGSMERPDRRQAVLRAFQTLTLQLKATDQVTLISFASTPRLLADKVAGNQGEALLQVIENLPSEGGTNIESALMLAREKAAEQQLAGAQNRIVLLTDGAVNLGNANPDSLAKIVTGLRDSGIAFDAAGISAHDLNDEVLEALTRQGDGRYYLLDSAQSANESFAAQIAGALRPSAQNVKVQVEFNPQRVGRYKLLGYEKHRLNKEDFRDDKVDAAEMAASEAGVAVYQFEIKPNGTGDVGSVSVRFRELATGKMVENRWPIPYESNAPRLEQAEPTMKLAASAALLAAKLSGGPLGDSVDLAQLQKLLTSLPEQVASQTRVKQLRAMIDQASGIK